MVRLELYSIFVQKISLLKDNPQYHDYNVPERVQTFINAAQNEVSVEFSEKDLKGNGIVQASMFATNHIMMTMGNDFQYENANEWFKNLDKLIKYVNAQVCLSVKLNLIVI